MIVKDFDEIKAFLKGELIGLSVEVVDASNTSMIGLTGVVVDETKNMLQIEDKSGVIKKVFKGSTIFLFKKNGKEFKIDGSDLVSRSWDRLKKKWQQKRW